ncbi:apolipoprotein C-II [Discoglossus pictus]
MKQTQVMAMCLLVLLVSTGIESYRIQKREAPNYLTQIQDFAKSSWEQVTTKAQELVESAKNTGVDTKVKEIFEKGSSFVGTYTGILYDQVYHWF